MGKQCVLGIDVGTSAVKVLAAEISADGFITIMGSGVVPTTGFSKGNIVDAPALVSVIRQAVDCVLMAADISVARTFIGLGGNVLQSFNSIGSVAPVSASAIASGDIGRASQAAALTTIPEEYCLLHVLPTAYWVDGVKEQYEPVGRQGSRIEVEAHIVAMQQIVAEEIKSLLAAAGIQVSGIMANTIAGSANLTPQQKEACIYLDMGAQITDVVLYQEGNIRLSVSLPLGGDYITGDIMHGLNIGRAHAEEVKRYYSKLDKQSIYDKDIIIDCTGFGTADKKVSFDFLQNVVESRIQEIVSLMHHYLTPALAGYKPQRLLITGGCSQMSSVLEAYERIFELPVHMYIPETAREYAQPENTACLGLFKLIAGQSLNEQACESFRPGIMDKIKSFLNWKTVGK